MVALCDYTRVGRLKRSTRGREHWACKREGKNGATLLTQARRGPLASVASRGLESRFVKRATLMMLL